LGILVWKYAIWQPCFKSGIWKMLVLSLKQTPASHKTSERKRRKKWNIFFSPFINWKQTEG
jgi:hypothetical protein